MSAILPHALILPRFYTRRKRQCVESVRIHSFSGPNSSPFGMNAKINKVNVCIQFKYRKIQTRTAPNTDTFYTMFFSTFSNNQNIMLWRSLRMYRTDTAQKMKFCIKVFSVNMTKCIVSCVFGFYYYRNL